MVWPLFAIAAGSLLGVAPGNRSRVDADSNPLPQNLVASKRKQNHDVSQPPTAEPQLPPGVFLVATTMAPMTNTQYWISATVPPAPTTLPPPTTPKPVEPKLDKASAEAIKAEIVALRNEVKTSNDEMWKAAKLIAKTVDADEKKMKSITKDITTLRGRSGGLTPRVATECTFRQASCMECTAVPTCVWCGVEQKCYSGDASGPLRGECAFFKHAGQCS
eukprot:gnl/MRDRNA2_/MRDRNA2_107666_c0_seq1.p1 gnl/MRDRNA2_/MRDRNA2_107666_c0~~gnl/MRDRNA2_/MRDRNA2_107666_c0_seq1.p1  ORF type:complete len:219 (+),score=43.65 gnl/MRDRNA2_/MRDRNA2_107666_c0_seq1:70-726(+)